MRLEVPDGASRLSLEAELLLPPLPVCCPAPFPCPWREGRWVRDGLPPGPRGGRWERHGGRWERVSPRDTLSLSVCHTDRSICLCVICLCVTQTDRCEVRWIPRPVHVGGGGMGECSDSEVLSQNWALRWEEAGLLAQSVWTGRTGGGGDGGGRAQGARLPPRRGRGSAGGRGGGPGPGSPAS